MPPEPLSDNELLDLWHGGESDRVEFKESARDTKDIARTICAFANDLSDHRKAGVLLIGLRDKGECACLEVNDELLTRLSEFSSDGRIQPLPGIDVEHRVLGGCDLALLRVHPASFPPVRFRNECWVRIGPTTKMATLDNERRLSEKRRAADLPYDMRSVQDTSIDDLDKQRFQEEYLPAAVNRDIIQADEREPGEQMRALDLLGADGKATPTGLLLVGRDPRHWFPGAYIQFVRRDGREITDPVLHQKEIDGTLQNQAIRLGEILEIQVKVAMEFENGRHVERPDYPMAALHELARNALIHRSYEGTNAPVRISWFEDRVEIHNPGGPFGKVSAETFGDLGVTDYRNPRIAEAMKYMGFMEKFGSGIQVAKKALRDNGNPDPKLEMEADWTQVTLRPAKS